MQVTQYLVFERFATLATFSSKRQYRSLPLHLHAANYYKLWMLAMALISNVSQP